MANQFTTVKITIAFEKMFYLLMLPMITNFYKLSFLKAQTQNYQDLEGNKTKDQEQYWITIELMEEFFNQKENSNWTVIFLKSHWKKSS